MPDLRDPTTGAPARVEARTQTPTGNALNVQIGPGDPISNIPVFIDLEQHQAHEGETHVVQHYTASVANIKFALVVPSYAATIEAPHMVIEAAIYGGAGQLRGCNVYRRHADALDRFLRLGRKTVVRYTLGQRVYSKVRHHVSYRLHGVGGGYAVSTQV